jgi:dTDP-4-dehydrorhamnose 3,5-epimerase
VRFLPTQFAGAFIVESQRHEDERGHFSRLWCEEEFAKQGLSSQLSQVNVSFNRRRGTLRGMHFQIPPHAETKLVRCNRGCICDVIVDLRNDSPTCRAWQAFELSENNGTMLYIPEGFAHGFVTLSENAEVYYQMSATQHAESARGIRWDDPSIGIEWPIQVEVISERDRNWASLA